MFNDVIKLFDIFLNVYTTCCGYTIIGWSKNLRN